MISIEREWQERRREEHPLAPTVPPLVNVFTERTGRAPESFAEVEGHFSGSFTGIWGVTPSRYLTPAEIAAALAPIATG